ncbi:MAG: hypothetical protein COB02_16090 [Candidatus Cloacimonadota bacterium]|nr:MAG: hypothetical protein COB02_16090 [Candidatus Cloacimonadota bacterium]
MKLKILGHSSVFIEFCGKNILVDPCLEDDFIGIFRRFPDLGELDFQLPNPDILFITHHHWDVVCIRSLSKLDKKVRVLIPENQQLVKILDQLKFENVQILSPWQKIEIESGYLLAIPSEVSFGELGFLLHDKYSTFLNLADNRINESIINKINTSCPKIDLTFAPYQSYDEMAILKKENSKISSNFIKEQALLVSKLNSKVILPFKDGLYYPNIDYLNKKAFLYSPYYFIDLLKEQNYKIQSEILIPLDEITISNDGVDIKRDDYFTKNDLLNLYEVYRVFDSSVSFEKEEKKRIYSKLDLSMVEDYLLEDFYRHLSPKIKKQCRLECVIFTIDIIDSDFVYEIDFVTKKECFISSKKMNKTCVFSICYLDLIDLIEREQLLSILIQTDRVQLLGSNEQMKYRALDIMFDGGFNDAINLFAYIENILKKSMISYFTDEQKRLEC